MTQVHVVQRLSPGGIEQLVLSMARRSDIRIFSIEGTLDQLCRDWPALEEFRDRITAFAKAPGRSLSLPLRIASKLREIAAASVVTHHVGPLLYGGAAARMAGVPAFAHVEHDAWHLDAPRRRQVVRAALSLLRPRRMAVSGLVARAAEARTGLPFDVVVNGVDTDRFRPGDEAKARAMHGLPLDRRIVGAAGRLETVKGFDLLVRAAETLPDDVLVVIWGDGSQASALRDLVAAKGLQERVRLAGPCSAMETAYPALDLYCLPSRREGLPLAILEAQSCGVPVVARNVGGVGEGVCPVTGILVAEGTEAEAPTALAAAIAEKLDAAPCGDPRQFIVAGRSLADTLDAYLLLERKNHA